MRPVRTACILAAGCGTRLGARGRVRPKGFIRLGRRPIVEESILRLRGAGVERIVVVTGHHAEFYERLGGLERVFNERYAASGSMYSLACARDRLTEDFLLLESDLVYEPRALETLLAGDAADAVLLSGPTGAGDEVYVRAVDGCLAAMSKDPARLGGDPSGELVGISRISAALFAAMLEEADRRFERSLRVDYETDALVACAARMPIRCPLVPDLLWGEIDDAAHFERVSALYPRVRERDRRPLRSRR